MIIALMGLIILILLAMLNKEKSKNNFVEENQVGFILEHFKRENSLKPGPIILSEEDEKYLKEEMLYAYKYKNVRTVNKLEKYYKELEAKLFKDKLDRIFIKVKEG